MQQYFDHLYKCPDPIKEAVYIESALHGSPITVYPDF